MAVNPALFKAMEWRCIGPYRGARVVSVAGDPMNSLVFYFGATGGGVWKSTDAGLFWENISDKFFQTGAVGAIAVSDSHPDIIYVGTGESCFQSNESHGDGIYKSIDGGQTWQNIGLKNTRHISKIRIHPNDPNTLYVAALGHTWGPNPERGVYKSIDGGQNWERKLFISENAGAIDLVMDPNNASDLYASTYELLGMPWTHKSGGPDSGLYKSSDDGDTWTNLNENPGFPTGIKGKIGVAISPAKPNRVWALVEAEDGGLFRSDDSGATWNKLTGQQNLWWRAPYYIHVFAHPQDPDICYVLSVEFWKSTDGGYTFNSQPMPHGDHHDLWVDHRNPDRMIEGSDGGATVTLNGGLSWSSLYNQPTASFFHITTDEQYPYRVYGTQMDNTAISVPSRTTEKAILWKDCYTVGPAESGHIAVHPNNPDLVYAGAIGSSPGGGGGNLIMYDRTTNQTRMITVWPESQGMVAGKDHKYRFQFHFPTFISPHDPSVLYVAGNVVFRSNDGGGSWTPISPDLTTNDLSKISEIPGGPITTQVINPFNVGSILSLSESLLEKGLLWAGSDDGLVHMSRDNGNTWENVTPKTLPNWALITNIDPSPHDSSTAYLSATCYKQDNNKPYLFRTDNYGKDWVEITYGIPSFDFTRVIREDPNRQGLLYAGSETSVYVSFNNGADWDSLQLNLPHTPIHDLLIHNKDIIIATHGRAIWIMDDVSVLHQIYDGIPCTSNFMYEPSPAMYISPPLNFPYKVGPGKNYCMVGGEITAFNRLKDENGEIVERYLCAGTNPARGVIVDYVLDQEYSGEIIINFQTPKGETIKEFSNRDAREVKPRSSPGMNRFIWDMRHLGISGPTNIDGPSALPGWYLVNINIGDQILSQPFEIVKDERIIATEKDLEARFDLLLRIRDKIRESNDAVYLVRSIKSQIQKLEQSVMGQTTSAESLRSCSQIKKDLSSIEGTLIPLKGSHPQRPFPTRLTPKLVSLFDVVASADYPPTQQSYLVFDLICSKIDEELKCLKKIETQRLPKLVDVEG